MKVIHLHNDWHNSRHTTILKCKGWWLESHPAYHLLMVRMANGNIDSYINFTSLWVGEAKHES